MYPLVLGLHSWTRWLVLIFGLIALVRAISGRSARRPWTGADNGMGAAFIGTMHLQLLLGLILYFGLSPWGLKTFEQMGGAAMRDSTARFFAVEHIAAMIMAVVCAQMGRSLSKRVAPLDPVLAHKRAALWFGVSLAIILLMIPWGLWNPSRPWVRF